jgi:hypothetical protein
LTYEHFEKLADGSIELTPLLDPLQRFDADDRAAPTVHGLRHLRSGTTKEFATDVKRVVTVSGRVDVLALVSDAARAGGGCNWGVPVVTIEVLGEGAVPWRKLVFDLRAGIGEKRAAGRCFYRMRRSNHSSSDGHHSRWFTAWSPRTRTAMGRLNVLPCGAGTQTRRPQPANRASPTEPIE